MTTPYGHPTGPQEPTEQLLRRALEAKASTVETDPAALSRIRERTANRAWWHRIPGGAMPLVFTTGAATAVAATITTVMFVAGSCGPITNTPPIGPGTSAPAPTGAPTSLPNTSPSPPSTSSGPAAVTANVPVYYLGIQNGLPVLYREYHRLPAGDGSRTAQTRTAITAMLDGRNAYDNDYYSQWPASAAVRAVSISGDTVTVDLSGAGINGYDPDGEKAALQQLIWTATAASQASGMRLLLDGKPVDRLWNLLPASGILYRAPASQVQGPVWIIDPQQGATSGTQVTVNLAGIVWEAAGRLRVRDAAGHYVVDRHIQYSIGAPSVGTAKVTLTLAPGTYTIEAFYYSAKDGSIQGMDDHTFIVQ
jgi:hypothetical protein